MNTTTPTPPLNEIEQRVALEIDAITTDDTGRRQISIAQLDPLAVETQLMLLLDSACGHAPLADEATMSFLADEYYDHLHASRGGLSWDAFLKYGRGCRQVAEAAKRHRDFIEGKKK